MLAEIGVFLGSSVSDLLPCDSPSGVPSLA